METMKGKPSSSQRFSTPTEPAKEAGYGKSMRALSCTGTASVAEMPADVMNPDSLVEMLLLCEVQLGSAG